MSERAPDGFGLVGMRERVALVGGALDLRSQPGEGTTVCARIPVKRREHEDGTPPAPVDAAGGAAPT